MILCVMEMFFKTYFNHCLICINVIINQKEPKIVNRKK
jgi:hypothetical protein